MNRQDLLSLLLPYHKLIEKFDYNLAIEWAIHLVKAGSNDADVLMLASFEPNPDRFEISPYVSRVVPEVDLSSQNTIRAFSLLALLYCNEISNGNSVKNNLNKLYLLYYEDTEQSLTSFYLLKYAWDDFDLGNHFSYYYDTTPNRIENDVKTEAKKYIDAFGNKDSQTK